MDKRELALRLAIQAGMGQTADQLIEDAGKMLNFLAPLLSISAERSE